MGFKNKKTTKSAEEVKKTPAGGNKPSQTALRAAEAREKALAVFHPTVIDWFKENLDVDLRSDQISLNDLYRLGRGEFSGPIRIVVTPQVYDRDVKGMVDMPRIQSMNSLRVILPMENRKPVAIDGDKHRIFLQTVPCRPLAELASPSDVVEKPQSRVEVQDVKFTENQIRAIEGVGISRDRLYGGFNHLSREEKADIFNGEIFPVDGTVKTSFGYVNVNGQARMSTDESTGEVNVLFEPTYPEQRREGLVIDIERARFIGPISLDFYEKNPDGSRKVDVDGFPVLNEAGRNIMEYGAAGGPVTGYIHTKERDGEGVLKEKIIPHQYTARVVNGNIYVQEMKEKEVRVNGANQKVFEVPRAFITDDGKIFVSGEAKPLAFSSGADRDAVMRGGFGVVEGASFKDYKTGKTTVYDAVVYVKESGWAEKYSPSVSARIIEGMKRNNSQKQAGSLAPQKRPAPTRRKVKFGQSL